MLSIALVQSCASLTAYNYWYQYSMTEPEPSGKKEFSDDKIDIRFWMDEKKIHMEMANKSERSLTVNWAEASYIHIDGIKYGVANIESMLTDRKDEPPATVIGPKEKKIDAVAPVKNIKKLEDLTWYVYPLFNFITEKAYDNKGKTFGLDIPLKIDNETVLYKFRFVISNVVPSESKA